MAVLTGDMLSGIGETLHGPDWRTWLAKRLRKSERTVRRYERDETRIPAVVRDELHDVIREQITVLEAFDRELA